MDKIFTPREVDAILPKVEKVFEHIDACRKRAQELATSPIFRETASASAQESLSAVQIAESARLRSQVEFLLQAIQEDIVHVAKMGGVLKDAEAGLVDFPGFVRGEEVWLCWKRGEGKIQYWHPIYSGYSDRLTLRRTGDRTSTTH